MNKEEFIKRAQSLTSPICYMCEQDLYASYCYKHHSDEYIFKPLKMRGPLGLNQKKPDEIVWTREEIEKQIADMSKKDYETFSLHSWLAISPE
jgi:hypothetical protein